MTFPSPQQQAVIDFVKNTKQSLVVEAKAGSGKTSVILEAAFQATEPTILLCAFNRRIADELTSRLQQRRLPRGRMIKAQTLHSIGLEIVRLSQPVELDRDATDLLVREILPSASFPVRRAIVKTVRFLKETCEPIRDTPSLVVKISELGYCEDPGVSVEVAMGALAVMEASLAQRPTLDFCDMIWRPNALDLKPRGRYKLVIVDEAQDMTLGQFMLCERLVAPGGRLMVVGDLRQEIYDWRGAAGVQIWKLMAKNHQAQTRPLTWSFRCARAIIREAQKLVPEIEPAPDAADGVVDTMAFTHAVEEMAIGDFFLSRSNAGAVTNALRARLAGVAVHVIGGFEELEPLLELLKKLDTTSGAAFTRSLLEWFGKENAKENRSDAQAERTSDRYDLLFGAQQIVAPHQLASVLRSVFKNDGDGPKVMFSTVHKAKGLEASRVFLLRSSFQHYRRKRDGSRHELHDLPVAEINCEYVAISRAINHLTWVIDDAAAQEQDP